MVATHINMLTTLSVCGQEDVLCVFRALRLMLSLRISATRQVFGVGLYIWQQAFLSKVSKYKLVNTVFKAGY